MSHRFGQFFESNQRKAPAKAPRTNPGINPPNTLLHTQSSSPDDEDEEDELPSGFLDFEGFLGDGRQRSTG